MKFSPFNPIYFSKDDTESGVMSDYVHKFALDDHIFFEVFHTTDEDLSPIELLDGETGDVLMELGWNTYAVGDGELVSFYELRDIDSGCYVLRVGEYLSNHIRITEDADELADTILIQYSMTDNTSRTDIYTLINGQRRYFEMRVCGGFLDRDWSFSVENEQFLTEDSDVVELFAREATDKVLTIGNAEGEPTWIGRKIGMIAVCDLLFIDGQRYSAIEDTELSISDGNVDGDRFVYTITLREDKFLNATFERIIRSELRRVPGYLRIANRKFRRI